jgi:patatin-like phospholipase/acyl hydrolase
MTQPAQAPASAYPILSIDGGGIRGIIPATMLVEVERITGKPISDLFRFIGGTSTGGVLALGLAAPGADGTPKFSAQDLLHLYTDPSSTKQIFQKNLSRQEPDPQLSFRDQALHAIANPRYLAPTKVLDDKFGDTLLSKSLTDVLITANRVDDIAGRVAGFG